ncbi:MAG: hypothetical protein LC119_08695 [Burkholderiales bacterium]|nr:hypothetical protein [Burkholderiales bacterium]
MNVRSVEWRPIDDGDDASVQTARWTRRSTSRTSGGVHTGRPVQAGRSALEVGGAPAGLSRFLTLLPRAARDNQENQRLTMIGAGFACHFGSVRRGVARSGNMKWRLKK